MVEIMNLEDLNFNILKTFKLDSGELTFNFLLNGYVEEKLMKLVFDENYQIKEFIYYLIYEPSFLFEEFNINESEMEVILRSFVDENPDFFHDFDNSNENFFEEFDFSIKRRVEERQKEIEEIFQNQMEVYEDFVENMYPTITVMNDLIFRNYSMIKNISLPIIELSSIIPIITPIFPISLIKEVSLTQNALNNVYNSLNLIDWGSVNQSLQILQNLYNIPRFDIVYTDKQLFALTLYNQIEEIGDNGELKSIFSLDFLLSLTDGDWWIIPRFSKEEYIQLSSIENINSNIINQYFIGKYYENPELLYLMIQEWDLTEIRKKIIYQAYINYIYGNFEACVIILMLQIEGILKEKISMKKSSGKLRQYLEKQLNNNSSINSWDDFLNRANIQYIWMVLNPLDDNIDFNAEEGLINRNNIAHIGIVEANQLIAIRFFFILDTLIYIFKSITDE